MSISMVLSFPNVLSVDTIVFLRRKLSDFFVSENMYTKIDIAFNYEDSTVSEKLLFEYYDYILSVFEVRKARFSFLKLMNKSFIDGNIKVFVANEEEVPTIEPLLFEINKVLQLFGLSSKCVVEVSNFEISTQSLIDKRIHIEDEKVLKQQNYYLKKIRMTNCQIL